MHPQIVRDGPGSCPICGMALEPMTPGVADAPNPELAAMTRRCWVGMALTIPGVLLEMSAHVPALAHLVHAVQVRFASADADDARTQHGNQLKGP